MARQARLTEEIRFRASPKDQKRLADLVRHFDLRVSALLRRLIEDAHKAIAPK